MVRMRFDPSSRTSGLRKPIELTVQMPRCVSPDSARLGGTAGEAAEPNSYANGAWVPRRLRAGSQPSNTRLPTARTDVSAPSADRGRRGRGALDMGPSRTWPRTIVTRATRGTTRSTLCSDLASVNHGTTVHLREQVRG